MHAHAPPVRAFAHETRSAVCGTLLHGPHGGKCLRGTLAGSQQPAFSLQPDRLVAVVGTTLLLPELARAGRDFIMGRGERGAGLGGGVGVEMAVVVVFHQGIEVERWSVIRFGPGVIKIERTPSARSGRHARPARLS